LILSAAFIVPTFAATPAASLHGTVVDQATGSLLAGAWIKLDQQTSFTDAHGGFAFNHIEPGKHTLTVSSDSHGSREIPVVLLAGDNVLPPISLGSEIVRLDRVVVTDTATRASDAFADKALTETGQDVVSEAALDMPSIQNASDALKGVAGVNVTRAANGATNVSIRGLAPQFNRISVDGQSQSNSGRFSSGSALDSVPPEILKSIEVTKSLTPDMDADAIGGVINLTTSEASGLKRAFVQGKEQVVVDSAADRAGTRGNLSVGAPFRLWSNSGPNDSGLVATVTYDDITRLRENLETFDDWPLLLSPGPTPFTGALVPAFTHANLEYTLDRRERGSLLLNGDTRIGRTSFFFKSNLTRDARLRTRSQEDFDPAQGIVSSLTPNSGTFSGVHLDLHGVKQDARRAIATVTLGEKTDWERAHVNASVGVTRTEDHEPHTLDALFSSADPFTVAYTMHADDVLPTLSFTDDVNPAGTAAIINDPAAYRFAHLTVTDGRGVDLNTTGQVDFKLDLDDTPQPTYLKFGAKVQQFRRSVTQTRLVYDPSSTLPATTAAGLVRTPLVTFKNGGYQYGPVPDPERVAELVAANPASFPLDATDTALGPAADAEVHQTIWAAYVMGRLAWGQWSLLGGVRLEGTQFTATANQPLFADNGSLLGFEPAHAGRSYLEVLPGLHLRYDPQPGLIFRASVYRSLIRPSYGDLAPYLDINFDQFRARIGNPNLKPYLTTNTDFTTDYYRESFGLFSAGFFFKSIHDFQVSSERLVTIGSLGQFVESQRINGDAAQAGGVETSWKSNPWILPDKLATATLALTYTFTRSASHLPDRPEETLPLPLQAKHQFSIGLHGERGPFSAEVTFTYHTAMLEEVVAYQRDRYEEAQEDLTLNVDYKLTKHTRIFAGVTNLLSVPSWAYSGDPSRLKEFESRGPEFSIGISWKP
jgi:TonB-dependent receptor